MKRVFAVVLASLAATSAASAQVAAPNVSLSPATVIARGTFGQSMTETITLTNGTPQGFGFEMSAMDVIVRGGKRVFVKAGDLPGSIAASAVFSQRSGFVATGSSQPVQVRVTVPDRTAIRAVAVYFKSKNVATVNGNVTLNASLGALLTFVLTNDIAVTAKPLRIRPASASQNLKVEVDLANTGTEPVVPQGVAAFLDANGTLAAKLAFDSKRLLPDERGTFTAEYAGRLKPGKYRVLCTFGFEDKTLTAEGTYTAP